MVFAQNVRERKTMKKNTKILLALAIILFSGIIAVINLSNNKNSQKISIVTTNFPAYDFARAVAGDKADIKILIKPGTETHDFEPTPNDIIDIKNSDLFIYTGGESDEWIKGILDNIDTNKTKFFKMMDAVNVAEEETVDGMEEEQKHHNDEEIEYDEHVWTSIKNATKITNRIKDELIIIFPKDKQVFEENTQKYTSRLTKLDAEFQDVVNRGSRKTIIFGDRFPLRYFVDDYGLDYFAAFPGCSEQTEASSNTIAFLVEKIKQENIPVIFKIEMSSGDIAETIANETNAKVLTFNTAHNISANDFKNGRTYVDIMEENLKALEEALR